jgi:hypothetical protein
VKYPLASPNTAAKRLHSSDGLGDIGIVCVRTALSSWKAKAHTVCSKFVERVIWHREPLSLQPTGKIRAVPKLLAEAKGNGRQPSTRSNPRASGGSGKVEDRESDS